MKKKPSSQHSRTRRATKAAIAATVLTVPMVSIASPGPSQATGQQAPPAAIATSESPRTKQLLMTGSFQKITGTFSIVGLDDGHTIYKNAKGEYFYLDPGTGDMKTVSAAVFQKFHEPMASKEQHGDLRAPGQPGQHLKAIKFAAQGVIKFGGSVTLLGVDAHGNVVQQNSRGEKFYLDADTGDMVFVK